MSSRNIEKIPTSKTYVNKSMSKTIFSHYLLSLGGALNRVFEDHVRSSPHYMGAMYVNFVDYCRPMFT